MPQGAGFVPLRYRRAAGSWNATSTDSTVWPCGRTCWRPGGHPLRSPDGGGGAGGPLSLFGPEAGSGGLAVSPGLERQKEGQWLPLLEILWETGRLEALT